MFEGAELGHAVDDEAYAREEPKLREALLEAQYAVREAKRFPVIVVVGGVDGAGKGETVNLLNEWLDPRHVETVAFADPTDEERERPTMFRFWRALPPNGKIGILFGSWYSDPIQERVDKRLKSSGLQRALERIRAFERMLTDDGALLLKFWFHLSKRAQKGRLEQLEKDPVTRWRVTREDWKRFEDYDHFRAVSERVLRETSTGTAPWTIVEGVDANYRGLTVGKALLDAMEARSRESAPSAVAREAPAPPAFARKDILETVDLAKRISKKTYEERLEPLQRELAQIARHKHFRRRAAVVVLEGADAAGKGGAIRRVTAALDARVYRIVPIAAPTAEERLHPYLWRFWTRLPQRGRFTIFDRSWYGRVLVERVEGFAREEEWKRAYSEINAFEEELVESRVVVIKLWLHVSPEEQKRRFDEREQTGFKRYKITEEDWRNREKWGAYQEAVNDMVERTSTDIAPWTLVPAEDKHVARLTVLETIVKRIDEAL